MHTTNHVRRPNPRRVVLAVGCCLLLFDMLNSLYMLLATQRFNQQNLVILVGVCIIFLIIPMLLLALVGIEPCTAKDIYYSLTAVQPYWIYSIKQWKCINKIVFRTPYWQIPYTKTSALAHSFDGQTDDWCWVSVNVILHHIVGELNNARRCNYYDEQNLILSVLKMNCRYGVFIVAAVKMYQNIPIASETGALTFHSDNFIFFPMQQNPIIMDAECNCTCYTIFAIYG